MRYEDYFDLREGMSAEEKRLAMMFGLAPSALCLSYAGSRVLESDSNRRAASVCPGLMLVGALCATATVNILTRKWTLRYSPYVFEIDLLTQKVKNRRYPMGMKSPWMRIKKKIALFIFNKIQAGAKKS